MNSVAVIGGGLSGTLLALNLLRLASSSHMFRILLIDREREGNMGPAYSTNEKYLLLNVPACRMGVFSANPEHFLEWVQGRGLAATAWDFLPRQLYREYVQEQLDQSLRATTGNVSLERICGEAVDITRTGSEPEIHIRGDKTLVVRKVVLAVGNFPPRAPNVTNRSFLESDCYIANPWSPMLFSSLPELDTVFLLGTGQTMVDLAIMLHMRGHKGKIIAISRHGHLPRAHGDLSDKYPSFSREIETLRSVGEIFKVLRKHIEMAVQMGMDRNAVVDSLRPDTQDLWMHLATEEKRRFLRHAFRYWEIIRSRTPPQSVTIIDEMRLSGQLEIVAGRVESIGREENGLEIHYARRGETQRRVEKARLLVNCVGPETDYDRVDSPLIKNLISSGLIQSDAVHLGIEVHPNGAIVHRGGTVSDFLYTLGPPMKGILWEVIAVPEIRLQAEQLARLLLKGMYDVN